MGVDGVAVGPFTQQKGDDMLQASLRMLMLATSLAQVQTHARVISEPTVARGAEGQLILGWATTVAKTNLTVWEYAGESERAPRSLRALSAQISPSIGIFVAPNFAVGLQGEFGIVRAGPHGP